MKYHVRHVTLVRYEGMVNLARFNLRLRPAAWPGQVLEDFSLEVVPPPRELVEDSGPFLVNVGRLTLDRPTASLEVISEFTVTVEPLGLPLAPVAPGLAQVLAEALAERGLGPTDPASYLYASPIAQAVPAIADWARGVVPADGSVLEVADALMRAIHAGFSYDGKATKADTPPADAFAARRGVCQDFAHVMIIALRQLGVPAAYVSGYLRTIPPPGKARLVGADATHAWVNVWCGRALGWVGFDPTNAMLVGTDHIFTAMGRDFADVSPLDGTFIGGPGQRMTVAVEVTPL